MDDKNIHTPLLPSGPYPEPGIPVEEAWGQMKKLLDTAAGPLPAGKPAHSVIKKFFIYGSAGLAAVVVIMYFLLYNKPPQNSSKKIQASEDSTGSKPILPGRTTVFPNRHSRISFDFTDTPLYKAVASLEKAYGTTIVFANNKLSGCRITTRFDNKTLEEILDIMAYTLHFEYSLDEKSNKVILNGKGCD